MKKMKKTGRPAWIWMAAAAVLGFTGISALAADPASIQPDRKGSITLALYSQESGSAVTGGVLTLYEVASLRTEETEDVYLYTSDFADCTISLADLSLPSLAEELDAWAQAHAVSGMQEASPDEGGHVMFSDLPLGLYLIRQTREASGYGQILPFLVTVPLSEGETWIYDIDAQPKVNLLRGETETETQTEAKTEAETDTETQTERETETETRTERETETETQTGEPAVPAQETPGGQPRSAKTGDPTPVAATLVLLFAGAAVLAAGFAFRGRARRG